ncbi:MAG: phosphoribosylglycinamide formyltransferase [Pseudonocardiales bacterium]|nr:phosphoribosylglycinamide formyltransferase [Jatrophihabitantaceae bacterium]MCW2602670.1 phosphoribosylglycinamide formyltransferase [Pseudonocardiales bacterium]
MPARLVILASGAGSTLQAFLDAAASGDLPAEIAAVGSDRPDSAALQRATAAGVPTFALPVQPGADRALWNASLAEAIAAHEPDLVVLAGFMRVLGPALVRRFRIVNVHPSLLPSFPGAHAIRDALAHGVRITGVTVHWVDEGLDSGPIIAQAAVEIAADDTEDTLRARIQDVEKPLYLTTIRSLAKELR